MNLMIVWLDGLTFQERGYRACSISLRISPRISPTKFNSPSLEYPPRLGSADAHIGGVTFMMAKSLSSASFFALLFFLLPVLRNAASFRRGPLNLRLGKHSPAASPKAASILTLEPLSSLPPPGPLSLGVFGKRQGWDGSCSASVICPNGACCGSSGFCGDSMCLSGALMF